MFEMDIKLYMCKKKKEFAAEELEKQQKQMELELKQKIRVKNNKAIFPFSCPL